jgi:hypothetical protein
VGDAVAFLVSRTYPLVPHTEGTKMKRLLIFFRLVDAHDGLISLTNVALIVVIVKLTLVKTPGLTELGTLLLALANYNAKKWMALEPETKP